VGQGPGPELPCAVKFKVTFGHAPANFNYFPKEPLRKIKNSAPSDFKIALE
jgi:hypothetical protein